MRQQSSPDDRVRPDGADIPHLRRHRLGVTFAVVVVVLLLAAVILAQRPELAEENSRVEALAVSEEFIEAHTSRDHEKARSLVSDTARISMNPTFDVDDLEKGMAWLEATEWVITNSGCSVTRRPAGNADEPVQVLCALVHKNAWSEAMGQQPDSRGAITIEVASGEIVSALLSSAPMSWPNEAVRAFESWLEDTHPDDLDTMYLYDDLPALNSESTTLWSRHTREFVEVQRRGG